MNGGSLVGSHLSISARVRMREVVLPQQVLAIIIAVWRAHYTVNVLLGGLLRIGGKLREVRRPLVVEFDQDYRALEAVVEGAVSFGAADPCEPRVFEVSVDFVHFHASVAVVHVADVQMNEIAQLAPRR
jgi:hypothetical protein